MKKRFAEEQIIGFVHGKRMLYIGKETRTEAPF